MVPKGSSLSRERRAGFRPADRGISSSWRAARVCRLLRVTEVCPAPPSSQLRPEAGPCRCPASTARRAGVQSHDALFRSAGRVSTSGVSKVGEGPRSAGTRRPPVQDRITHPGRFTQPRANHSQYVEQRVVPHVISLPCRTRASIVTCWRPCALLARSIRARALTPRRPCHPLVHSSYFLPDLIPPAWEFAHFEKTMQAKPTIGKAAQKGLQFGRRGDA